MCNEISAIPEFYLELCDDLYRNEFRPGSDNWPIYEAALNDASAAGLDRENSLALLVAFRACEEWRSNLNARDPWLTQAQFSAERSRGTVAFQERAQRRFIHSERGINNFQSLIALGYVLACGTSRAEARHWYPLAPALDIIITVTGKSYSREEQIKRLVAGRLRRLKNKETGQLPTDTGRRFFAQVHATLFD